MSSPSQLKNFLVALAVLTLFHAIASLAAYRVFVVKRDLPVESTVAPTVIPAQSAAGESSFRMMTGRSETFIPMPVALYIIAGFVGLGIGGIIGAFGYLRGG